MRGLLSDYFATPDTWGVPRAIETVTDRSACQREFVNLALQTKQLSRADVALERLLRSGCGDQGECIDLYSWAALIVEQRGRYPHAVRLYRRILDTDPGREDILEHIGALGNERGVVADAIEMYGILARRHPEDVRWPARLAELQNEARPPPAKTPAPSE